MRRILFALDTIDILFLAYSNKCEKKLHKLSIKCLSCPKSTKVGAFEQKHAFVTTKYMKGNDY